MRSNNYSPMTFLYGLKILALLALVIGTLSGFTSCSSGSGSNDTPNVNTGPQPGSGGQTYTGPAPATDDVQTFKLNVWDNLVADNRCGGCHQQGGSGAGFFVRDDDINLAYSAANLLVDLSNPGNSRLVTKVAGGHNCWETDSNACADIITGWISAWANASGSVANVITLTAPAFKPVQDSRNFPTDPTAFQTTVYSLLTQHCSRCHSPEADSPQMPFFASSDVASAYAAAQSKIDLSDYDRAAANPPETTRSRFIVRLRDEFHNCWSGNCASDAAAMEAAILAFAGGITPTTVDENLLTSGAVTLTGDGIVASSGGRIESDAIALYTFKPPSSASTGENITEVFDVSGTGTAANLRAFGSDVTWVGGWGARINSGRLQGGAGKLYDLITLTGEYTIEAWLVPGNVVQDNAARIVTYAGGALTGNNFAMAQSTYNYDFLHRGSTTDQNGLPAFSTPDAEEVLQATLQHAVLTYDPINGRRIYVNGENVSPAGGDPQDGGNLSNWDSSFALTVGQNAGGGDQWQGTVRLLAIHNRALTAEDIRGNFQVGVGEKFYLLFDLSRTTPALVTMPQAFIAFEVEQFDSYGYLFKNPFFISLDASAQPGSIRIQGMRIGLNGRELDEGQAYANLDVSITNDSYTASGHTLSNIGTLIPLENGPDLDQFFLTFDHIGSHVYNRPTPDAPPSLVPAIATEEQSLIGIRHFEAVNTALSQMTGITKSNNTVANIYANVRQQLPQNEAINGFLPAHQMAMTQLAIGYCNALASNAEGNRQSYFPVFLSTHWNTDSSTVFATDTNRDAIINPILDRLAANNVAPHGFLATQPDPADVSDELNALIDRLLAGTDENNPTASSVEEIVTSVCAAAMGSAIYMIQ
jgi:mono/diheme cytochrome c family protein